MRTLLILLAFASPIAAAEPKKQSVVEPKTMRDVRYADTIDERQTLDVFYPREGKDHPIVFWIHGGGWQAGDKKEVQVKPQAFVDKGFVFVSTNYRFVPKVTIEEMAYDIATAFSWVHSHAKEFDGDSKTIFVMGHSAGAQLAALISTDAKYLTSKKLTLANIKGCVPVDGDTYDVPFQIATVEERRATIYKKKFGDEKSQKDLSPITHVAKGKNIPPFLILHVATHPEVRGQSQRLAKALQEVGIDSTAYPAEGKTHATINSELGLADDEPTKVMFKFLDALMKPRTVSFFKSKVDKSLTPSKAEAIFGKPDRDLGSGLMIYEYTLNDGSRIVLGFPGEDKIIYARHIQKNGVPQEFPLK